MKGQRELKVPYDGKLIYLVVTYALEDKAVRMIEQVCGLDHYGNLSMPHEDNVLKRPYYAHFQVHSCISGVY